MSVAVAVVAGGAGRPLRFLASVAGGWTLLRILLVWNATGSLPQAMREVVPLPMIAEAAPPPVGLATARVPLVQRASASVAHPLMRSRPAHAAPYDSDPARVQMALLAIMRFDTVNEVEPGTEGHARLTQVSPALSPATLAPRPATPSRWSGSAWAIARSGRGIGASADAPQLGGAQGGVRIDYALRRDVALTGRIAAPAAGAGREVSAGVAWRPAGGPVRLTLEQRVALDGGRGGTAVGASGGVSAVPIAADFALEAYGQAGVIARRGVEHYADGIARVTRRVAGADRVRLDLGIGAWGGTQRGVARLDTGPSASMTLPIVARTVRVSLDWRQRIAGDARPGSGPTLSLGSDF